MQPLPSARNIQPVKCGETCNSSSAGKQATCAKRGKTSNRCQARENKQPVPSAGKQATGAKRGKTNNRCQARENKQPVLSAGKQATGAMRGKTSNRCQARENKQPMLIAGKRDRMCLQLQRKSSDILETRENAKIAISS